MKNLRKIKVLGPMGSMGPPGVSLWLHGQPFKDLRKIKVWGPWAPPGVPLWLHDQPCPSPSPSLLALVGVVLLVGGALGMWWVGWVRRRFSPKAYIHKLPIHRHRAAVAVRGKGLNRGE